MTEDAHPDLELVRAAMMEELGIGRKDTLPLEDRGYHDIGRLPKLPGPRAGCSDNPWKNAVFDDVDEAELGLDNIADGQLYRLRRGVHRSPPARGSSPRGERGAGKAERGHGSRKADRGHRASRGGHALSPGRNGKDRVDFSVRGALGPRSSAQSPISTKRNGRRATKNQALVDATISRLRKSPRPVGDAPPRRRPVTSAYGANLVSGDEFYTRTRIASGTARPSPSSQSNFSSVNPSHGSLPSSYTSSLSGLEGLQFSVGVSESPSSHSPVAAKPICTSGFENRAPSEFPSDQIGPAKALVSTTSPNSKSPGSGLSVSNQLSTPGSVAFGQLKQAGLAGSRWASLPEAAPPDIPTVSDAVSTSTSNNGVAPSITNEIPPKMLIASKNVVRRKFENVKISNDSLPEMIGSVWLVTASGEQLGSLEIWINNVLVLNEALYKSDIFMATSSTITFRAYSEKGGALTWRITCQLPYQSTVFFSLASGLLRNEPRPLQEQPTTLHTSGDTPRLQPTATPLLDEDESSTVKKSATEATTDSHILPGPPDLSPRDSSKIGSVEESPLLIDLDSEEDTSPQESYVSPRLQDLMVLMTDEKSIMDILERLNQPTGSALLDRVIRIAGPWPAEGYSPQMLSAARTQDAELYQSGIFHRLGNEMTESLVEETSQQLLEEALVVKGASVVKKTKVVDADEGNSATSTCHKPLYSSEELLTLRSRASTIEGNLIPDNYLNRLQWKRSPTKASERLSRDSSFVRSCQSITNELPTNLLPTRGSLAISVPATETKITVTSTAAANLQAGDGYSNQDTLSPDQTDATEMQSASALSYKFTETAAPANSTGTLIPDAIKPHEPAASESVDSDLLVKLSGLNLESEPTGPTSPSDPFSMTKEEEGNESIQSPSSNAKSPPSITEISNVDLKGNPGLAASTWGQDTKQPASLSRRQSIRSSRADYTPRRSTVALQPLRLNHSPQPMPKSLPQPFIPRLTTVLVPDPTTSRMREVTSLEKITPGTVTGTMPFPSNMLPSPGLPAPFTPVGLLSNSAFKSSGQPSIYDHHLPEAFRILNDTHHPKAVHKSATYTSRELLFGNENIRPPISSPTHGKK